MDMDVGGNCMGNKEATTNVYAQIWYGLEAEKLKFKDHVQISIEGDKLVCYQNEKNVLGNTHGTTLLRIPIYRVNGFLFDTVGNIGKEATKECKEDEMCGENIAEAAQWLSVNAGSFKKALILSYKGAKNAPVNVIYGISMVDRPMAKRFMKTFEIEKQRCIAERKERLVEKE